MRRFAACLAMLAPLLIAGCETAVQTSSGDDYLAARPGWTAAVQADAIRPVAARGGDRGTAPIRNPSVEQAVMEAARASPELRFPARFGLARIEGGRVTAVPPQEADVWIAMMREQGARFGEFVAINPLLGHFGVAAESGFGAVDRIRIAAARQHVDAVLIYEARSNWHTRSTPLSVFDITLVGSFLMPSTISRGQAVASAMLLDVRNGYPYGNANANAEDSTFGASMGSNDRARGVAELAKVEAVRRLAVNVTAMMDELKTRLTPVR